MGIRRRAKELNHALQEADRRDAPTAGSGRGQPQSVQCDPRGERERGVLPRSRGGNGTGRRAQISQRGGTRGRVVKLAPEDLPLEAMPVLGIGVA